MRDRLTEHDLEVIEHTYLEQIRRGANELAVDTIERLIAEVRACWRTEAKCWTPVVNHDQYSTAGKPICAS